VIDSSSEVRRLHDEFRKDCNVSVWPATSGQEPAVEPVKSTVQLSHSACDIP
jgi:hypothetical protein